MESQINSILDVQKCADSFRLMEKNVYYIACQTENIYSLMTEAPGIGTSQFDTSYNSAKQSLLKLSQIYSDCESFLEKCRILDMNSELLFPKKETG